MRSVLVETVRGEGFGALFKGYIPAIMRQVTSLQKYLAHKKHPPSRTLR